VVVAAVIEFELILEIQPLSSQGFQIQYCPHNDQGTIRLDAISISASPSKDTPVANHDMRLVGV
jgi:hypothetical protein